MDCANAVGSWSGNRPRSLRRSGRRRQNAYGESTRARIWRHTGLDRFPPALTAPIASDGRTSLLPDWRRAPFRVKRARWLPALTLRKTLCDPSFHGVGYHTLFADRLSQRISDHASQFRRCVRLLNEAGDSLRREPSYCFHLVVA